MTRVLLVLMLIGGAVTTHAAGPMKFWNLTKNTVDHLYLAPAGTDHWTKDQCTNDPDKSVDPDERLRLTDVQPGRYDVKLSDVKGRTCLVHNVQLNGDKAYAFALSESDLKSCSTGG